MSVIINVLLIIGTFFFMEGVAWFTHKYIMHGILWSWHKSHHRLHGHALEMNDLFAIVFSIPSFLTIYVGINDYNQLWWLFYIGIGILAYGIFYFIFHDVIVHRRIKIPFKAKSRYMKRIISAHYLHHKKHTKEDCEAFGFLYAPKKYVK
ncbi:MAG: beta-carotene hydroxylase [Bacteroidota bacterium]